MLCFRYFWCSGQGECVTVHILQWYVLKILWYSGFEIFVVDTWFLWLGFWSKQWFYLNWKIEFSCDFWDVTVDPSSLVTWDIDAWVWNLDRTLGLPVMWFETPESITYLEEDDKKNRIFCLNKLNSRHI